MIDFNRLFGIGLNKTGTTSLQAALELLGIPSMHYTAKLKEALECERLHGQPPLSSLTEYRAFLDFPICQIYPELDVAYPGSKFICTTRDLAAWLDSRERHVRRNQKDPNYRGNWTTVNREAWEVEWHQHQNQVADYFRNRPEDLIWMDIFAGDGWDKLCSFLRVPSPGVPFPWENSAAADARRRSCRVSSFTAIRRRLAQITRRLHLRL